MSQCRLCLSKGATYQIFDESGNLATRIYLCCQLRVQKNDRLPKCICFECFNMLEKLSRFIKNCKESEEILKNNLKNNRDCCDILESSAIKIEIDSETDLKVEENCDFSNVKIAVNTGFLNESPVLEIKKEICEDYISPDSEEDKSVSKIASTENFREFCFANEEIKNICLKTNLKNEVDNKKICIKLETNKISTQRKQSEKTTICHICAKECKSNRFKKHVESHYPTKMFSCSVCAKEFNQSYKLRAHEQTHSKSKDFSCLECGKRFRTPGYVTKHMNKVHLSREKGKCTICDRSYTTDYLKQHMRSHTALLDFICDICENRYTSKAGIVMHMRTHTGEKPFACKYCEKRFTASKSLIEHVRLHTGETPHKCPICGKGFAQKPNMKSHFRHNHKDLDPQLYFPTRGR